MSDEAPAEGYEVFCDPCYFDYWAARKIGVRDFYETAHFATRDLAIAWTHEDSRERGVSQ